MRRGVWHQLGWNHQKLVTELLQNDAGVGVILSPRDLSYANAKTYVAQYRANNALIVNDPQWFIPGFDNKQLNGYPIADFRNSVTSLTRVSDSEMFRLKESLVKENRELGTDALIAPAVLYTAGRTDVIQLNRRLHQVACDAAAQLGIPCYGTAFLGQSITNSIQLIESTLSAITSLSCDGWYFGFEFPAERIPSSVEAVYRCLVAALLLAQTGKPVLHAYAGPMGILSFASGCVAVGAGPSQKQWRFCPERWEKSESSRRSGHTPARYFSGTLWGTIVFPDETALLPTTLLSQIYTESPFATSPPSATWPKGDEKKHLIYTICKGIERVASHISPTACRHSAATLLSHAIQIHRSIRGNYGIELKDHSTSYQANWCAALIKLEQNHRDDFDFLDMLF